MRVAVLGLGESLKLFTPEGFDTVIGVNDIWKHVHTEVIVCLDPRKNFTPERLKTIDESRPVTFYSQIVTWDVRPDFHKLNILAGYPDSGCPIRKDGYWKSYCSPFVAVQIAFVVYHATEIHLFGVDLVNHPHLDQRICQQIRKHFRSLKVSLTENGCNLVVHGKGILIDL